ncbi:MAG: hypothetical protein E2O77_07855, partial [Caldithrix sp.]
MAVFTPASSIQHPASSIQHPASIPLAILIHFRYFKFRFFERKAGMKLGVISDTHGYINPKVFPIFEGVEQILHAGDIGS